VVLTLALPVCAALVDRVTEMSRCREPTTTFCPRLYLDLWAAESQRVHVAVVDRAMHHHSRYGSFPSLVRVVQYHAASSEWACGSLGGAGFAHES
jgi:hypothetical protein